MVFHAQRNLCDKQNVLFYGAPRSKHLIHFSPSVSVWIMKQNRSMLYENCELLVSSYWALLHSEMIADISWAFKSCFSISNLSIFKMKNCLWNSIDKFRLTNSINKFRMKYLKLPFFHHNFILAVGHWIHGDNFMCPCTLNFFFKSMRFTNYTIRWWNVNSVNFELCSIFIYHFVYKF